MEALLFASAGGGPPYPAFPLLLLHFRHNTTGHWSLPPPRLSGIGWSPVRSVVAPHREHQGWRAMASFTLRCQAAS